MYKRDRRKLDWYDLLVEFVQQKKAWCYSMLDFDDQKELAQEWLDHPELHVRKEAEELLGETAMLCSDDWVGHFIKNEHDKVSEVIMNEFIHRIKSAKVFDDEMETIYDNFFNPRFEDPAPRRGGRMEDVL